MHPNLVTALTALLALAGFELEDGIYLLGPLTWLGWLAPFFIAACVGAGVYLLYTAGVLLRTRSAHRLAP